MKIVLISDIHSSYPKISFTGDEDMIIHAGDMTYMGEPEELRDFIYWFGSLPVTHKITIAGNHDFGLEARYRPKYFGRWAKDIIDEFYDHHIHYLEDSSINIDGVEIYGSPWSPEFHNWAFNQTPKQAKERWAKIPETANIVVTHSPLAYYLDRTRDGSNVGCHQLYERMMNVSASLHVCGHIHEGYGNRKVTDTLTTVNASILDEHYTIKNPAVVVDIDSKTGAIKDLYYLEVEPD